MASWKDKLREAKGLFLDDLITAEEFAEMKAEIMAMKAKEEAQEEDDIFSGGETRFVEANPSHQDTFGVGMTQAPQVSSTSEAHQLTQGTIFDARYVIVLPLGKGGMGAVYQAVDMVTGQPVAVKILHPQFAGNKAVLDSLVQEVALGQRLNHTNLLQIRHLETKSETPYLIMELMDGGDAQELAQSKGGILTPEQLLPILEATCSGLSALHKEAIVHLDIKPQNILITKGGRICLADFGISSKMKDQRKGHSGSGTVLYAAPEQLQGGECGVGSDIYAVGMMCYQLLTGGFPFDAHTSAESIINWHAQGVRDFRGISPAFQSILEKACHVDIHQRYRNALSFYHDFKQAIEGAIQPVGQKHSPINENPNLEKYRALYKKIVDDGYVEDWEDDQLKGARKKWNISNFDAETIHRSFQQERYHDLEVIVDGEALLNADIGSVAPISLTLHNKELILLEQIQIRYQTLDWECKELETISLKSTEKTKLSLDIKLDAIWKYNLKMMFHIKDFLGNDRYFKTPEAPFSVSVDGIQTDDWEGRFMENKGEQQWAFILMQSSEEEWKRFIGKQGTPSKKYIKAQKRLQKEWKTLEEKNFLKEAQSWHQSLYKADSFHEMILDVQSVLKTQDFREKQLREKSKIDLDEKLQAKQAEHDGLKKDLADNLRRRKLIERYDLMLAKPALLMQNGDLLPERRMQLLIAEWKRLEKEGPDLSEANEIQRLWEKRHDGRIERLRDRENSLEKDEKQLEMKKKELAKLEGKLFSMFSSKEIERLKDHIRRIEERIEDWKTRINNNNTNRANDAKESKEKKEEAIAKAKKDLQAQIDSITAKLIETIQAKREEALIIGNETFSDIKALKKKGGKLGKVISEKEKNKKSEIAELKNESKENLDKGLSKIQQVKKAFTDQLKEIQSQLQRFDSKSVPESFHQNLKKYSQLIPMEIFRTYFFFFPEKREEFEHDSDAPLAPLDLLLAILALPEQEGSERVEELAYIQELIQDNPGWENPLLLKVGAKQPYQMIGEAIEKAPIGAVLYIEEGTYREDLKITKDLHLVGSSKSRIRSAKGSSAKYHIHCMSNKLADISIFDCDIYSKGSTGGLVIEGLCSTTISRCQIASQNQGIYILGGVQHYIVDNRIQDCNNQGIQLSPIISQPEIWIEKNTFKRTDMAIVNTRSTKVSIKGNRISESSGFAIFMMGEQAAGLIEGNQIFENESVGIACQDGASPIIRNNKIYKGESAGVYIGKDSNPLVQGNQIYQNNKSGIMVAEGGKGRIKKNNIYGNIAANIQVKANTSVVIQNNKIYSGGSSGISFAGKTDSLVEGNDIYQNKASGVFILDGANPTVRGNKLHHNKVAGCSCKNEGKGLIEKNDIFENEDVQVLIRNKADPIIKDNRIYKGGSLGVSVFEQGKGIITGNDIFQNKYSGIKIADGSKALIENNKIHDNGENGIWAAKGASGVVQKNQIYNTNSKFKTIKIMDGASPTVRDNIEK